MLRAAGTSMFKTRQDSTPLRKAHTRLQAFGARLREMWEDIVHEPIPDDMMALLEQIDERERQRSSVS